MITNYFLHWSSRGFSISKNRRNDVYSNNLYGSNRICTRLDKFWNRLWISYVGLWSCVLGRNYDYWQS